MVNLRPVYVQAVDLPPHSANSCMNGRRYGTHACFCLTNHELCPADSPKGEFLISQTVLRYASIDVDLI